MAMTICADCGESKFHKAQGVCAACYERRRRRAAGSKPIMRRPDKCIVCEREMYSSSQTKPKPSAVQYRGNGMCSTCARGGKPKTFREPSPSECIDCGVPMRPYNRSEADHPGTRKHASKGRCTVCYGRHIRGTDKKPKPEPTVDPALEAFNRKRRERLAAQQRAAQIRKRVA